MAVLRAAAFVIGVAGFAVLYVLIQFYPAFPRSIAGWMAVFFVALPFLAAAEWAGSAIFGAKFLAKRSSPVRVSLGVVMTLALLAVILPVAGFVAGLINS